MRLIFFIVILSSLVIGIPVNSSEALAQSEPIVSEETYSQLYRLISLCSVSYCSTNGLLHTGSFPDACPTKICAEGVGYEVLQVFEPAVDQLGASGYIAINHGTREVFVVFRGSQTDADWATDFEFTPVPYTTYVSQLGLADWQCDNCLVHKGFYASVGTFMQTTFEFVVQTFDKNPSYKLSIIGHSLGGALAVLTGLEFKTLGYEPLVVAYAQPKVAATFTFVDKINYVYGSESARLQVVDKGKMTHGYYRVTHKGDVIPDLPPGYVHAGVEFHIKKKDLPQPREDVVVRKGVSSLGVDAMSSSGDLSKEISGVVLKTHEEYLIKVTGCK